jgi:beta-N-acetylhexosaminidase
VPQHSRRAAAALVAAGLLGATTVGACTGDDAPGPDRDVGHHPPRTAAGVLADMSLRQRVGQLFMVGTPATTASRATLAQITQRHVGNVMLTGRSHAGTRAPAHVAAAAQARATARATDGVRLLVATDQEGGQVQVLDGPGIADVPTALQQGRWSPGRLSARAAHWARQLRAAGVTMNLAPVADTVPSARAGRRNAPIGAHDRAAGYRPAVVARYAAAFTRGMLAGGVVPTAKHFPGLGRVRGDTDASSGVTDLTTRRHDPYLRPFAAAIDAGVPFVMMSTAYYRRLDAHHPAAFSRFVIGTVLRRDLGFRGVVVSDDVANARQVARWAPGQRAVAFLRAGGDLVLTVDPRTVPAMYRAVLDRAARQRPFHAKVDRSALRILRVKEEHGLL